MNGGFMKKFNASIFVKIWLSISMLFLGYIVSMVMIQVTGGAIKDRLNTISGSLFPAAKISQEALATYEKQIKFYQDAVMMGEVDLVNNAKSESDKVLTALNRILGLENLKRDRVNEIQSIHQTLSSFSSISDGIYKKMASGDMSPEVVEQAGALSKIKDELFTSLSAMVDGLSEDAKGEIGDIISFYSKQQLFNLVLFFIVLSVSVIIVWLVTKRSIVNPVNTAINALKKVAPEIDLTSSLVSSASQSLAEGSSEQAASIEETSSSLEEMSSMTRKNADNASEANNLMKKTSEVIQKANVSMTELTGSMEKISKASQETSKIIKTIDEIAFQTNLLALNAAVEAARAGEAGAGFAVVADEVRNLAMRAAEAAKSTSALIEDTVRRINDGTKVVSQTNEAFSEVFHSATTIKDLVEEIAAASNDQAQGIEQINKAVTEMDKVVQQNAASAEESASASQEMNSQAGKLNEVVDELAKVIGGNAHGTKIYRPNVKNHPKPGMHHKKAAPSKALVTSKKRRQFTPEEVIHIDESDLANF
ncbi:MAG: hypothetical protein KKF30_06550 [Proteobacteria bacterium]|nr:hypothetical protein [Pseudomonadota bacterium]MBU4470224.1 hypothetical protein [Pseudomonadota bacterium]